MDKKNKYKSITDEFKDKGLTELPTTVKKPKSKPGYQENSTARAMTIVNRHQTTMISGEDNVIMKRDDNNWLVASLTRGQYYTVKHSPPTEGVAESEDLWECFQSDGQICPAKQFHPGDCKHVIAVKICLENNIKIPTEAEAMGELFGEDGVDKK